MRQCLLYLHLGLAILARPSTGWADALLNEVLADPATDWNGDGIVHSRDDEWVEIANPSGVAVDLTGVRIASADSVWRYEFTGTLPPNGIAVVYGSQAYAWQQATGNPAYGLRLANTGGTIGLWRISGPDTIRIDEVTFLDEDAEDDRSTGRRADAPDEWVLFDALNPYEGDPPPVSTGCAPTPDRLNECASSTREESWSVIKSLFGAGHEE
jgi:hypothetical protein